MTGRYKPARVEPRKPYDADEPLTFEEVARLCQRSVEWVEARSLTMSGVFTNWVTGAQWIRRGDLSEWIRAAEAEDYQPRTSL